MKEKNTSKVIYSLSSFYYLWILLDISLLKVHDILYYFVRGELTTYVLIYVYSRYLQNSEVTSGFNLKTLKKIIVCD